MSEELSQSSQPLIISSADELKQFLIGAGIPVLEWGIGIAKSTDDFYREIYLGESRLIPSEFGLIRSVALVRIDVYFRDPDGTLLRLREARQEFPDGRVRERSRQSAIAEKCLRDESPQIAVQRALAEELGITRPLDLISEGAHEETRFSQSYPGLLSHYIIHSYRIYLEQSDYKAEGYTECSQVCPDTQTSSLTTYFAWSRI